MLGLSLSLSIGNNVAGSSGGAAAITFDPSASNAALLFTNGNLTVEETGGSINRTATIQLANSKATSSTTGQAKFTIVTFSGGVTIGLIDKTVNVVPDATWIGSIDRSIAYWQSGTVSVDGGAPTTGSANIGTYGTVGDVLIVRHVGNLVGFSLNGTWLNGVGGVAYNPATGANGFDVSAAVNGAGHDIANVVPAVTVKGAKVTLDISGW